MAGHVAGNAALRIRLDTGVKSLHANGIMPAGCIRAKERPAAPPRSDGHDMTPLARIWPARRWLSLREG
jgi:hypothetical protein